MHLIKDNKLQVSSDVRATVQHGAQDLGSHDKARGFGVDLQVTRQ